MVYFWVKFDEKSNLVAFQANLIPHVYDKYNVTTVTHENCKKVPHGVILTDGQSTCAPKTLADKAVLQGGPRYILQVHGQYPIVSIFSCTWIFLAQGEFSNNVPNLLGEVKIFCFWL